MNDKIYFVAVQTDREDREPYVFYFLDESEQLAFAEAITGHADDDGELFDVGWDLLSPNAEDAIKQIKELFSWKELPGV